MQLRKPTTILQDLTVLDLFTKSVGGRIIRKGGIKIDKKFSSRPHGETDLAIYYTLSISYPINRFWETELISDKADLLTIEVFAQHDNLVPALNLNQIWWNVKTEDFSTFTLIFYVTPPRPSRQHSQKNSEDAPITLCSFRKLMRARWSSSQTGFTISDATPCTK